MNYDSNNMGHSDGPKRYESASPYQYRSIVGPIILVVIGLVFLLSNLGIIQASLWSLAWRLWPVWLIAVGFDLLVGRRYRWGSFVVAGTTLAILFGAAWYMETANNLGGVTLGEYQPVRHELKGANDAQVTIKSGVGALRIQGDAGEGLLADGQVRTLAGSRLNSLLRTANGTAYLEISETGTKNINIPSFNLGGNAPSWNISLADSVPMSLRIATGVGESVLNLQDLNLRSLTLETGVGRTELYLPASGSITGSIETGVGETVIYVPQGMAARLNVSTGIGSVDADGDFNKIGRTYETPDFGTNPNKVDISIKGGIGAISIIQR